MLDQHFKYITHYDGSTWKRVRRVFQADGSLDWQVKWAYPYLYSGAEDNKVFKNDPSDGNKLWEFTGGSDIRGVAAALDGSCRACDTDHAYGIGVDGSQLWSYETGTRNQGIAVDAGGNTYVVGTYNKVIKIDTSGNLGWEYDFGVSVFAVAIGPDGQVVAGGYGTTGNKDVRKLNLNGTHDWTFSVSGQYFESLAIDADGYIFAGSIDEDIYKISPTGSKEWDTATADSRTFDLATDLDGNVYLAIYDEKVRKLDGDGNIVWTRDVGVELFSIAVDFENNICYGDIFGNMTMIDQDGNQIWQSTEHGKDDNVWGLHIRPRWFK